MTKSRFGNNIKIIQSYDGIFLVGLDVKHNTLYTLENGDSNANPPIPFRYWELDFSNNLNLLNSVLLGDIEIHDLIINGTIPSRIIRVVDYEYGKEFYDYLQEESLKYIPTLPYKELSSMFKRKI